MADDGEPQSGSTWSVTEWVHVQKAGGGQGAGLRPARPQIVRLRGPRAGGPAAFSRGRSRTASHTPGGGSPCHRRTPAEPRLRPHHGLHDRRDGAAAGDREAHGAAAAAAGARAAARRSAPAIVTRRRRTPVGGSHAAATIPASAGSLAPHGRRRRPRSARPAAAPIRAITEPRLPGSISGTDEIAVTTPAWKASGTSKLNEPS